MQIVVLSAHLDDAVFSLGAAIAAASRAGVDVVILTVLAGDPSSRVVAGAWDAEAGFATAGEAAWARRLEDERACAEVGARPVWLPYSDVQYPRGGSDAEIRGKVDASVAGADVVLRPGFPLGHSDHRWLAALLERPMGSAIRGAYVEQPYAALWTPGPDDGRPWLTVPSSDDDASAKRRACEAYATQVPLLRHDMLEAIREYEAERGGETIAWDDGSGTAKLFRKADTRLSIGGS